ncbi:hypothetical protein BJ138DRAFT_1156390 [Hygrophoropsis aurantiaca]|uniref:Uncharacterized protein n=1 Tax=Hygrophoropsis aurantiaca TaxID=72124 RepID=A0ACB8A799_9AGAM|nr:hypothetical protein BJ138DRAFT_1156390 [Hygrophoropsis aurantiaca]
MSVAVPAFLPGHLDSYNFDPPEGGYEELPESATDGSDPFSRLLVFARSLLERRRKEKEAALSDWAICLRELATTERDLTSAIQMCDRAHLRVSILDAQPKPSRSPLTEIGDLNPTIYGDIVATIEESEAKTWVEDLQFQSFLAESQNAPPQSSILELAKAIVEESCVHKASVEQRYKRCLLQHRVHEAAIRKVENACAAAERAISTLSAHCHL